MIKENHSARFAVSVTPWTDKALLREQEGVLRCFAGNHTLLSKGAQMPKTDTLVTTNVGAGPKNAERITRLVVED